LYCSAAHCGRAVAQQSNGAAALVHNQPVRLSFPHRVIEPELLDELPPGEGRASLQDLERINRRWGGYSSTRKLFDRATRPDETFSVLDVGAASGDMARFIRHIRPRASVTSFDRVLHHLERAGAPRIAGDAFRLPFGPGSFDFVYSSLFLHHFPDAEVVELFRGFAALARRAVLAVDLERSAISYWFIPATRRVFGWDRITVHDAPVSVAAGFRKHELAALAGQAGLARTEVRSHGIAFRLTMYAETGQARSSVSR
jgi:SAM-dependent methyltransferase